MLDLSIWDTPQGPNIHNITPFPTSTSDCAQLGLCYIKVVNSITLH